MERLLERILYYSNWITKIAYLNLLWILFTVVGIVLFGFFPATAAMFSISRKWVIEKREVSIFKFYFHEYKEHFKQSNLIGYILLLIGLILYIDLRFFQTSEVLIFQTLSFIIIFLFIIYFAVLLYIFPIFTHYQFNTMEYIKYSFILVLGQPFQTLMMLLSAVFVLLLFKVIPGLIPFFFGSLFSVVLIAISSRSFYKSKQVKT